MSEHLVDNAEAVTFTQTRDGGWVPATDTDVRICRRFGLREFYPSRAGVEMMCRLYGLEFKAA